MQCYTSLCMVVTMGVWKSQNVRTTWISCNSNIFVLLLLDYFGIIQGVIYISLPIASYTDNCICCVNCFVTEDNLDVTFCQQMHDSGIAATVVWGQPVIHKILVRSWVGAVCCCCCCFLEQGT